MPTACLFSCARQGALSCGLKSHAGPARGTASCTARVSIARWNLKEAGGKALVRRTETRYEAKVRDKKAKIFKVQSLHGTHRRRSGGHKRGRECAIPGEVSWLCDKASAAARLWRCNREKSAEVIVSGSRRPRTEQNSRDDQHVRSIERDRARKES